MEYNSTFRLVLLSSPEIAGRTAASPTLARLIPGDLSNFRNERIGLEQTDWVEEYGKPKARRTILIEAESTPGEWVLGT